MRSTILHGYKYVWFLVLNQDVLPLLQLRESLYHSKQFNIADAARNGISLDRIKKEIEKCIVLCANCHAIRHYNMRNNKQISLGIDCRGAEELNILLAISQEEEDAYNG